VAFDLRLINNLFKIKIFNSLGLMLSVVEQCLDAGSVSIGGSQNERSVSLLIPQVEVDISVDQKQERILRQKENKTGQRWKIK